MNRAWHDRHPMPKGAAPEARLAWHLAHQNACGCRPVPARLLAALAGAAPGVQKKTVKRKR